MLLSFVDQVHRHILRSPGAKRKENLVQINLEFLFVDFEGMLLVDQYMISLYMVIAYRCISVVVFLLKRKAVCSLVTRLAEPAE